MNCVAKNQVDALPRNENQQDDFQLKDKANSIQ